MSHPSPWRRALRLPSLTLALLLAALPAGAAEIGWRSLELTATDTYALRYLPTSADLSKPLPVILFLHGTGSYPEQWKSHLVAPAEAVGAVIVVPRADHHLGFGPGDDLPAIQQALELLRSELTIDETRIAIAGHSSGGAYAAVAAYDAAAPRFSAAFALGAPYRIVVELDDPLRSPPIRHYYGSQDPNYQGGSWSAWRGQWQRLGLEWQLEVGQGHGHNDWPATTLADGFRFLVEQRLPTPGGCIPGDTRLCLLDGELAVELTWGPTSSPGRVAASTPRSGFFWLTNEDYLDVQVRTADRCARRGEISVRVNGLTRHAYELTVLRLATGEVRTYRHPGGRFYSAFLESDAFSCAGE